jgi:prophage antirepressor-like protein
MKKKAIEVFNFEDVKNITVIVDEQGEPWWVAKEVCDALGIVNTGNAVGRLDEDEKSYIRRTDLGLNPGKDMVIVNEPGLYELTFTSKKPSAKVFKRWIKRDVLPTIRKSGGYIVGAEEMTDTQILDRALKIRETQVEQLQKKLDEVEPKAIAYDEVIDFTDPMTVTTAAKSMGLSAIRLNQILCENKIIFKQYNYGATRVYSWVPAQKWLDKGYFDVKLWKYYVHGQERFKPQMLVTPEGLHWLINFVQKKAA